MKFNYILIIGFLCCTINTSFAQQEETLFGRNQLYFSGFWAAPVYNFSFFDDELEYMKGGFFGFEFGKTLLIGWGHQKHKESIAIEGVENQLRLRYNTFFVSYTPQSYKAIHPVFSMYSGGGRIIEQGGFRDRVFVFQPSGGVEVNIAQWFRIGLEGGYRFVNGVNVEGINDADVSSPFAQIDLKFGFSWGRSRRW